jgi:hypothetical protein
VQVFPELRYGPDSASPQRLLEGRVGGTVHRKIPLRRDRGAEEIEEDSFGSPQIPEGIEDKNEFLMRSVRHATSGQNA